MKLRGAHFWNKNEQSRLKHHSLSLSYNHVCKKHFFHPGIRTVTDSECVFINLSLINVYAITLHCAPYATSQLCHYVCVLVCCCIGRVVLSCSRCLFTSMLLLYNSVESLCCYVVCVIKSMLLCHIHVTLCPCLYISSLPQTDTSTTVASLFFLLS